MNFDKLPAQRFWTRTLFVGVPCLSAGAKGGVAAVIYRGGHSAAPLRILRMAVLDSHFCENDIYNKEVKKMKQEMKHEPVVARCAGCPNISGDICTTCFFPAAKWRNGNCNYQPTLRAAAVAKAAKKAEGTKINPLKASKRAAARKSKEA